MCQHQIPNSNRKLEINNDPDGQKYYILKSEDDYLTVLPWCFAEDRVKVYVETSHLSQVEFQDNDELTEALKNAPRQYQEWIFKQQ